MNALLFKDLNDPTRGVMISKFAMGLTALSLISRAYAGHELDPQHAVAAKAKTEVVNEVIAARMSDSDEKKANRVRDRNAFFVDFLYWDSAVDEMELATSRTTTLDGTVNKRIKMEDGKWKPGVRLGYSHLFTNFDKWDLVAFWTYYKGESTHASTGSTATSNPCATCPRQNWSNLFGPQVLSAKGEWDLKLNLLDLELGRTFNATHHIDIRPYFGIRGAWLDLQSHNSYNGAWIINGTTYTERTSFKGRSDFSGAGLRGGVNFNWGFAKYVSLFTNFAGSLLWGNFDIKERFHGADATSGTLERVNEEYKQSFVALRTNLEALIGLKYTKTSRSGKHVVSFMAAYEMSKWFRFNELFTVNRVLETTDTSTSATFLENHVSSDIGFQGLTCRLMFDF